jgi:PAS domain S-box-containing protein
MMERNREIQGKEEKAVLHFLEQSDLFMYQFLFDPKKGVYSFPYSSSGIQLMYEVLPEEVEDNALKALNRIHYDDVQKVYNEMEKSMNTLSKWNCDYRVVLPKSGLRWLRGEGTPELLEGGNCLWTGYIRDITDRKKVEQELRESKQRLQFALEGSRDGVWDWNVVTNDTFYSNESKRMVGFEINDTIISAEFWNERVHPEDRDAYYQDIKEHLDGNVPFYTNEHRILCKDGNYKWILDRGMVISRNKRGEALRVIGTHSDIDSQKKRESDFQKTIALIESQNDRLINFAHIVSHNLKSYAGNFESLMTMILETNRVDEKLEYFDCLHDVSSGLSETIVHLNEIVAVKTNVAHVTASINLNEFITKTLQVLQADIQSKGAIVQRLIPRDLNINYNPAYLESILLNLISNGLKYTHKDRKPVIKIETMVQGEQIILQISDNGIGLDLKKFGSRLFGMYQTFHGNEDAKGIGLFLTKNQLTAMGDDISVRSVVDEGSEFQIIFNKKQSSVFNF